MQFTADGRLCAGPVWCKLHSFEDDYHWTSDVVAVFLSGGGPRDEFWLIHNEWSPAPAGRKCAQASVARGDYDQRAIGEWRG